MSGAQPTGLRERKKKHTRTRILQVARDLFVQQGYNETSLNDIGTKADIAVRTLFGYFSGKSDIFFAGYDEMVDDFIQVVESRPEGQDAIGATIAWHDSMRNQLAAEGPTSKEGKWRAQLRRIVDADPVLQAAERQRYTRAEDALAKAIAADLRSDAGDPRPALIASMYFALMFTSARLASETTSDAECTFANIDDWVRAAAAAITEVPVRRPS